MSNCSISVTRVSTGSQFETQQSQSPAKVEVPLKETSNNETTYVQVIPPSFHNPTPKMIYREETSQPQSTTQVGSWGGPKTGNNFRFLLNFNLTFVFVITALIAPCPSSL